MMISFARRFWTASEGVVAAEFAMIAPLMIVMFFGATELSDGLEARSKVGLIASSAADLVARDNLICDAEMNDVFAALNAIVFPYPANNAQIRISSIVDGGNGTAKVAWSDARNTTPRLVDSTVAGLPSGLIEANGSVILAEVTYNYHSTTGKWVHGTIAMTDQFYQHPRRVAQIGRSANNC